MNQFILLMANKLLDPLIPSLIERTHQNSFRMLIANSMINWVIGNQFEVSQSPVVAYSGQKIVYSRILNSEFTRIIRIYGYCMAKS